MSVKFETLDAREEELAEWERRNPWPGDGLGLNVLQCATVYEAYKRYPQRGEVSHYDPDITEYTPIRHFPIDHLRCIERSRRENREPFSPGPIWWFDVVCIATKYRDLEFYAEAWQKWYCKETWLQLGYDPLVAWSETKKHLVFAKQYHSASSTDAIDRRIFVHNQSDDQYTWTRIGDPKRKPFRVFDTREHHLNIPEELSLLIDGSDPDADHNQPLAPGAEN